MFNRRAFGWCCFVVALYWYLGLFRNALIDDAFINLLYARNILRTSTWGVFPGLTANSATSPLNTLLLAFVSWFVGPTVQASILTALTAFVFIAWFLLRISFHMFRVEKFGVLAFAALLMNPLLISTIGLESIAFVTLFVALVYLFLVERWYLLAVTIGLLILSRADGALLFLVVLVFIPTYRMRIKVSVIVMGCIAPWYLFSWLRLGSLIPDTFFIKTGQGSWGAWTFSNGAWMYFDRFPFQTVLSVCFLPLMALGISRRVSTVPVLRLIFMLGIVHYFGYSVLRVPPYHWYYTTEVVVVVLLGCFGLGVCSQYAGENTVLRQIIEGATVAGFLIPALGMVFFLASGEFRVREMPIHTNWAYHERYKEVGLWLKENTSGQGIELRGEIGSMAYYCDCFLLDAFSDRKWLAQYVSDRATRPGVLSWLFRVNFLFFSEETRLPTVLYQLVGSTSRSNSSVGFIKQWETMTNWVPAGLIVFSSY